MSVVMILRVGVREALKALGRTYGPRVAREFTRRFGKDVNRGAMVGVQGSQRVIRIDPATRGQSRYYWDPVAKRKVEFGKRYTSAYELMTLQPHEIAAMVIISALYLAYFYGSRGVEALNGYLFGSTATGAGPLIPRGWVWVSGPRIPWAPPPGFTEIYPNFRYQDAYTQGSYGGADVIPRATDAEINSNRSCVFGCFRYVPEFGITNWYGWGRIGVANPDDYEPWDSAIHGKIAAGVADVGLADAKADLEQLWADVGLPPLVLPWAELADTIARPSVLDGVDSEARWREAPAPYVPVTITEDGVIVTFPGRGNGSGVDVRVPVMPGWGSWDKSGVPPIVGVVPGAGSKPDRIPVVVPGVGVRPGVRPGVVPGVPPVVVPDVPDIVTPGTNTPVRVTQTGRGQVVRVVSGPVVAARTNVHEGKPGRSNAIFYAMQVRGAVSEFEDLVEAFWKALPASLRKKLRQKYGRTLTTTQMLGEIFRHYQSIDYADAVANVMVAQIDDLLSGTSEQGLDKIIQQMVPDFEARMLLRQVMRAARHGQGFETGVTTEDVKNELMAHFEGRVREYKDFNWRERELTATEKMGRFHETISQTIEDGVRAYWTDVVDVYNRY